MTPDQIRNIGILAHVDAGKTTLTEQFLYLTGAIRHPGSVDSGTTQTDFLSVERDRGISVRSAQTTLTYKNCRINLIDTPGHADFAGEVERSLAALDGAILLISAVEGVQSHTENLWRALDSMGIPVLIFINKVDRIGSHANSLADELPERLGGCFPVLSTVSAEESRDCAVSPRPDLNSYLTETLADFDDALADAYLSGETIDDDQLGTVFRRLTAERKVFPTFFGSAGQSVGVEALLDGVIDLLPAAPADRDAPLAARIFRIEHDKTMGKIAHVRMYGGSLKPRDPVTVLPHDSKDVGNGDDSEENSRPVEKISQIRKFNGQRYIDVPEVAAGDIAALCGLSTAGIWDYIGDKCGVEIPKLANPFLQVKAIPAAPEQLIPLVNALRELSEEDPLLSCRWEKTEREILLNITGKIQLEVLSALLSERYNLTATFSPPSVIYKETPSKAGYGFEAYTMPKPCWAVVRFLFEPLPRGSGVVYDGGKIPSNKLFYRYQTHIRQSFFRNLEQGMLGWEVTDFKATLVDGEHHTIHTHPLDFFVATPMAIMDGLRNTGTTLLEPFLRVKIHAGRQYLGKILSDITLMRGEFDDPVIRGEQMTLEASLPVATSMEYPVKLAAMTGGTAILTSGFEGYRECPLNLGQTCPRRGINPLDRAKWILQARGAIQSTI